MVKKGLDTTFVHFGIRKDDLQTIETICNAHNLDFDWVKDEILKEFHDRKTKSQDIDEKIIERIIDKALLKISN